MKKLIFLVICCGFIFFVSCGAPQKKLSRDQWLELSIRHYDSSDVNQVIAAVETLFNLADDSDVTFSHAPDSITAVRHSAPIPFHFWYHWNINILKAGSGVNVTVSISMTTHALAVPSGMMAHQSSDVLNLFFSRLDYLLGISNTWISCQTYKNTHPDYTTLEALCLLADDKVP